MGLASRTGLTEHILVSKELATWVDLGVLREDAEDGQYTLLEIAEERVDRKGKSVAARGTEADEEPEAVSDVQQQQAEQMKVHWKVRLFLC